MKNILKWISGLLLVAVLITAITLGIVLGGSSNDDDNIDPDNIQSALTEDGIHLHLKDHGRLRIMSGSIHYFRMPQESWRDRLEKLKATGANTVETYMSWNLHEPRPGQFDFSGNLDIAKFIEIADELGLLFILRPGPYICSEWDFGGMPAWLLHDRNMKVRSTYPGYQDAAKRYLDKVYEITKPYMRTTNGGPIILIQLENEYNGYRPENNDQEHLRFLHQIILDNGIKEKVFTSDGYWDIAGSGVDNVWTTINFDDEKKYGKSNLAELDKRQPGRPTMVTEYWSGWFDHWFDTNHGGRSLNQFSSNLETILNHNEGSSVNMYMFFGGTNFGWMNGANTEEYSPRSGMEKNLTYYYVSDTTSYDYDAPLTEAGHLTDKFHSARELISSALNQPMPSIDHLIEEPAKTFPDATFKKFIKFERLINYVDPKLVSQNERRPIFQEYLNIHDNTGQSYGYTVYEKEFSVTRGQKVATLSGLSTIQIHDNAAFMVVHQDEPIMTRKFSEFLWYDYNYYDRSVDFKDFVLPNAGSSNETIEHYTLIILAENFGRVNYGSYLNDQRKGVDGELFLDGKRLENWTITPLEFDEDYVNYISDQPGDDSLNQEDMSTGAFIYEFEVEEVADTYLSYLYDTEEGLHKGMVFVNGRNLGRYCFMGPQMANYIPKQWLKVGTNKLMLFEEMYTVKQDRAQIYFRDSMLYREDIPEVIARREAKDLSKSLLN